MPKKLKPGNKTVAHEAKVRPGKPAPKRKTLHLPNKFAQKDEPPRVRPMGGVRG